MLCSSQFLVSFPFVFIKVLNEFLDCWNRIGTRVVTAWHVLLLLFGHDAKASEELATEGWPLA
jgi:hypothetical protein